MHGRCEIAPSAKGVDVVAKLSPFANIGQRPTIRLVPLARDARTLRHYECVDVRVAVVVAPRPDVTKGPWKDEIRAGIDLRGELAIRDRCASRRHIDKYRERGRGDLL